MLGEILSGDNQNRNVMPIGVSMQRREKLKPIHFRHHEIKNDNVWQRVSEASECDAPVIRLRDFPPLTLQAALHIVTHELIVVDHQHPAARREAKFFEGCSQTLAVNRFNHELCSAQREPARLFIKNRHEYYRNVRKLRVALDGR